MMRNASLWTLVLCAAALLATACSSTSTGQATLCADGCPSGLSCLQNADFPLGACTAVCNGVGTSCPTGSVCTPLLSTGSSYCLQTCSPTSATPCPNQGVCTTTSVGELCLPASESVATPMSCPAPQLVVGSTAGPSTQPACQTPVVSSALASSAVQDLGVHSPGTTLTFQVPASAAGFSIVEQAVPLADGGQPPVAFLDCQGSPFPNVPMPTPVLTPQGGPFYDAVAQLQGNPPYTSLDATTYPLFYYPVGGEQPYTQALTFPNTTAGLAVSQDAGLAGGSWSFTVNDFANLNTALFGLGVCDAGPVLNSYNVSVVVTPSTLPATPQLSADIYLVTETLTAAAAQNNSAVQRFVNSFANIYAGGGVCVKTVTLHDVPQWAKNLYASLPTIDYSVISQPCSDFRQMFTLAQPGSTVALFLVDELAPPNAQGEQIVGIDGSIPGMGTYNGTIAGGAVVSVADLASTSGCSGPLTPNCGPDRTALIAAHETGHALGLYHPTEETGDVFDPLSDTPACVCALCETGSAALNCSDGGTPTLVDNTVCSGSSQLCGGANDLMFWILTPSSRGQLSPQEVAVMRANPLLSQP